MSEAAEELRAALRDHQVVVVAGETGSGKTTQLPKLLLQAGFGVRGSIAHTQPRRLAARTVANRIADETGCELGKGVGFAVRFSDAVSEETLLKVMTDGLLLNEIRSDRFLDAYDAIIIDAPATLPSNARAAIATWRQTWSPHCRCRPCHGRPVLCA